jgi:hypothetical protein
VLEPGNPVDPSSVFGYLPGGRLETIEQGKGQLTPERRSKLSTLLASSTPRRTGTPTTFDARPQ